MESKSHALIAGVFTILLLSLAVLLLGMWLGKDEIKKDPVCHHHHLQGIRAQCASGGTLQRH